MFSYRAKLLRVIDGDTVVLDIDLGCHVHIHERCRLARIDAADHKDGKGEWLAAKDALATLLDLAPNLRVETIRDRKGKYGRYIVELFAVDPEWDEMTLALNINDEMVTRGFATYR